MTKWELRFDAKSIWAGMLADIATAKDSIELEQFSFHDDRIGRQFLVAFAAQLKRGVKIRLIVDAVNSSQLLRSHFFQDLVRQGLQVQAFHPVSILHPAQSLSRAHKKTLVVDGQIAWVGGLGIKEKFENFRDTQIRLVGPVAKLVHMEFESVWTGVPASVSNEDSDYKFLVNRAGRGEKQIYEWLISTIQQARNRIYITSSYFYPTQDFFNLVLAKAKQGVKVKIILRGKNDEFMSMRFAAAYFSTCLQAGIEVYRFQPMIMHAKTLIIDDWGSVGSSNLDKFSFSYNAEANVVSRDPEFVQALSDQFEIDLKACHQLTLADWQQRPVTERIIEKLLWPVHSSL